MKEIKRLPLEVIQKIAAGEIIQKPRNALKELLENSLDANSSRIQVTIKDGGVTLLQIQDDGCGINLNDFPLVCERFCTSKLKTVEDLLTTSTFGFRGEALSAISFISQVTIVSRTKDSTCAYKAEYEDGNLTSGPVPIGGNFGTTIIVKDMFKTDPLRKNSILSSFNEEYLKIIEIITKYSIRFHEISFSCKKAGNIQSDVATAGSSNSFDVIKVLFPLNLCQNLSEFKGCGEFFEFYGHVSKLSYYNKRTWLALFVNNRLVQNNAIKRIVESIFSKFSLKGNYPWVFLSITADTTRLDINIHPTKKEVRFLDEDMLLEQLIIEISNNLSKENYSTEFNIPNFKTMKSNDVNSVKTINILKPPPKALNRVDSNLQTITQFNDFVESQSNLEPSDFVVVRLTSVLELRAEVENRSDKYFKNFFKNAVLVGVVDKNLSLFQYETKLFILNLVELSEEFFYQLVLSKFQNFTSFSLEPSPSIKELLSSDDDRCNDEFFIEKSEMLKEYFGIVINDKGELTNLPVLLNEYAPDFNMLDLFFKSLNDEILWLEEKTCLRAVASCLAKLYKIKNLNEVETKTGFYSQLKNMLITEKHLTEGYIKELTDLSKLYKIFERC